MLKKKMNIQLARLLNKKKIYMSLIIFSIMILTKSYKFDTVTQGEPSII